MVLNICFGDPGLLLNKKVSVTKTNVMRTHLQQHKGREFDNTKEVFLNEGGIKIDPHYISVEGDRTCAVIAPMLRFNTDTKKTEVLVVNHRDATNGETTRVTAGSSKEGEKITEALIRKVTFLTGLTPTEYVLISEKIAKNSSRDPQRQHEVHTKLGFVVIGWTGELITIAPMGGETTVPCWVTLKDASNLFRNHQEYLGDAVAYIKRNLKTDEKFTDL